VTVSPEEEDTIDPEGSVPGAAPGDYGRGAGEGLEPGIERTSEFEVADRLLTDVGGTIGVRVLSTPGMIAMLERNAAILSYEHLPRARRPLASRSASSTSPRPARARAAPPTRACARLSTVASFASTLR